MFSNMQSKKIVSLILRVSLAFAFLYPAISAYFDPATWLGYFPPFMLNMGYVSDEIMLHAFGIVEIVLAIWVLSGFKVRYPALLMALMLLAIVMFNLNQFEVVFRDLSLIGLALALIFMDSAKLPRKKGMPINLNS